MAGELVKSSLKHLSKLVKATEKKSLQNLPQVRYTKHYKQTINQPS